MFLIFSALAVAFSVYTTMLQVLIYVLSTVGIDCWINGDLRIQYYDITTLCYKVAAILQTPEHLLLSCMVL